MGSGKSKFDGIKSPGMNRKEPDKKKSELPLFMRKRVRFERFSTTRVYCGDCSPENLDMYCPHTQHPQNEGATEEESTTEEKENSPKFKEKGIYFLQGDVVVHEEEEVVKLKPIYPFATVKSRTGQCKCANAAQRNVTLISFKKTPEDA